MYWDKKLKISLWIVMEYEKYWVVQELYLQKYFTTWKIALRKELACLYYRKKYKNNI